MTKVQQLLTAIVTMLSIVGAMGKYVADKRETIRTEAMHEAEERRQIARDREHIRQLEKILVAEFPRWTAAIDWDDK